jgi:hypothetical protein
MEMYQIIEALMIVHNVLEELGDGPTTIKGLAFYVASSYWTWLYHMNKSR